MKSLNHSILLFFVFLLTSCKQGTGYKDAVKFSRNDFPETDTLKAIKVKFDSLLNKPLTLHIYDSLLLTTDFDSRRMLQIYNLKTGHKIGERIDFGQDKGEMLAPIFVENDDKTILLYDRRKGILHEYYISEFVKEDNPKAIRSITLEEKVSPIALMGNDLLGYYYCSPYPLHRFNISGHKTKEMLNFPKFNVNYSDRENKAAFTFSFSTNGFDKFVLCYNWTDLIEFYDKNGQLIKRMHGPNQFYPSFKERRMNNVSVVIRVSNQNHYAYFFPTHVGNKVYVLYDGDLVCPQADQLSHEIFVFDWNGNPIKRYILNEGIITFSVDQMHKKIYGISDTPQYHIVEFSYV